MRFGNFSLLPRRRIAQLLLAYFFVIGSVAVFNPCFADQPSTATCAHCVDSACTTLVKLNCDLPQSIGVTHHQSSMLDLPMLAPPALLTYAILATPSTVRTAPIADKTSSFSSSPPLYLRFGVFLI